MMIDNNITIANNDTKILRHEQTVEIDAAIERRRSQKWKKIIVCLTAKNSKILQEADTSTMDLNKKDQETS
jgi:hypothetical protein